VKHSIKDDKGPEIQAFKEKLDPFLEEMIKQMIQKYMPKEGKQGLKGSPGIQGPAGLTGQRGAQGPPGTDAIIGPHGEQHTKDGRDPVLIERLSTRDDNRKLVLSPDGEGGVYFRNLPKPEKGQKGDKGDRGPAGRAGVGYPGDRGPPGTPGIPEELAIAYAVSLTI
jgi:hypothetical protein